MARQFKPGQLRSGSLFDITSSFALTASYAANTNIDTYRIISGSVSAEVNVNTLFLVKSASIDLLKIQSDRVLVLATQSAELSNPAPNGGIYFTSGSFFVGLE